MAEIKQVKIGSTNYDIHAKVADSITGVTATATELNYTDGVTSNIQTQLNNKAGKTVATQTTAGLMSSSDKIKLDNFGTIFDIFPTKEEVNTMSDWAIFTTRGYYDKNDGFGCTYVVRKTQGNLFIPYGNMFIRVAFVDEKVRDIKPEWYGIRRGSSTTTYAAENSAIMDKLQAVLQNGYTLSFGSGHYYFDNPIELSKWVVIKGVCTNSQVSVADVNIGTYLHFSSISNGQAAINFSQNGVVQDVGIIGNSAIASVTLNRDYTTTDPNSVVSETNAGTTYGIKTTGGVTVQDVRLRNFTYGIYTPSGNFSISGIDIRQCIVGISVESDVKISDVQVWNVMTGIQLRGLLASATNIRGDSIGKHLVECWRGKCILSNIDGDYCVGSLIHYGDGNTKYVHLGQATGCIGRIATKYSYARTGSFDLTQVPDDDYDKCSYISIAPNTKVFGGQIDITNVATDPMDTNSGYVHPNAILSIGSNSTVKGLIIKCNVPYDADLTYFNKNVIKNLSTTAQVKNAENSSITDFDGTVIEDIMFITPVGNITSRRTVGVPDRQIESTSRIGSVLTTVDSRVPTANINDNVWEAGFYDSNGTVPSWTLTYGFHNANYIPVEGGQTVGFYYEPSQWNNNNIGYPFRVAEYDADKNFISSTTGVKTLANNGYFVCKENTAYIRFHFYNANNTITDPLTDIKVAIYCLDIENSTDVDANKVYIEPYITKKVPRVNGEKVILTSSDGIQQDLPSVIKEIKDNLCLFIASTTAPDNTGLLWIDTNATTGGLKYYNGTEWVHVPVAYT